SVMLRCIQEVKIWNNIKLGDVVSTKSILNFRLFTSKEHKSIINISTIIMSLNDVRTGMNTFSLLLFQEHFYYNLFYPVFKLIFM
ncbi:mCG144700, partial [Mus musculus]